MGNVMAVKKKKKPVKKKSSGGKGLAGKAKSSGIALGTLKKVYKRGQAAYLSSGSRNVPMAAWAMGRVNSFIKGSKKHDTDLRKGAKKKTKKKK